MNALSTIGTSAARYQIPVSQQAKTTDERTESAAVKATEKMTSKDTAVAVNSSNKVNILA